MLPGNGNCICTEVFFSVSWANIKLILKQRKVWSRIVFGFGNGQEYQILMQKSSSHFDRPLKNWYEKNWFKGAIVHNFLHMVNSVRSPKCFIQQMG